MFVAAAPVVGCHRPAPSEGATSSEGGPSDTSRGQAEQSSVATGAPMAPDGGARGRGLPAAVSATERAASRRREAESLREGRLFTRARQWAEAERAFAVAAQEVPGDARPLAERGYAELLAGDLGHAEADLRTAETKDAASKLAAEVAFNLGLVRERQGDAEGARAAFARSVTLSPTKAARAKLGDGGVACAVDLRTSDAPSISRALDWKTVVALVSVNDAPVFKDDAEARAYACNQFGRAPELARNTCTPDGAVQIVNPLVSDLTYETAKVAVISTAQALAGAPLLVLPLGVSTGWPADCVGARDADVHVDGDLIVVTISNDGAASVSYESAEDARARGVDPKTLQETAAGALCGDGPGDVTTVFFDLRTQRPLIGFTSPVPVASSEATSYTWIRRDRIIDVTGPGCDLHLALGRESRSLARSPWAWEEAPLNGPRALHFLRSTSTHL